MLPTEREKAEDETEYYTYNEKADHCFPSNVLYDHAVLNEGMHNVEEDSLKVCAPFKALPQEDINDMSIRGRYTTEETEA